MEKTNGKRRVGKKAANDNSLEGEGVTALIAQRAREKWQARGRPSGDDRCDWFDAEQEIWAAFVAAPAPAFTAAESPDSSPPDGVA